MAPVFRQFCPNAGIAESQNRTLGVAPENLRCCKPAIFNLWNNGRVGTAIGLRTARHLLSLVSLTIERPFEKEKRDANTLARPALRRSNVVEETGIHFDRRRHAGAQRWR